jgi:hypothetical protein
METTWKGNYSNWVQFVFTKIHVWLITMAMLFSALPSCFSLYWHKSQLKLQECSDLLPKLHFTYLNACKQIANWKKYKQNQSKSFTQLLITSIQSSSPYWKAPTISWVFLCWHPNFSRNFYHEVTKINNNDKESSTWIQ